MAKLYFLLFGLFFLFLLSCGVCTVPNLEYVTFHIYTESKPMTNFAINFNITAKRHKKEFFFFDATNSYSKKEQKQYKKKNIISLNQFTALGSNISSILENSIVEYLSGTKIESNGVNKFLNISKKKYLTFANYEISHGGNCDKIVCDIQLTANSKFEKIVIQYKENGKEMVKLFENTDSFTIEDIEL